MLSKAKANSAGMSKVWTDIEEKPGVSFSGDDRREDYQLIG